MLDACDIAINGILNILGRSCVDNDGQFVSFRSGGHRVENAQIQSLEKNSRSTGFENDFDTVNALRRRKRPHVLRLPTVRNMQQPSAARATSLSISGGIFEVLRPMSTGSCKREDP